MRQDYDGTPITDIGPRCRHCDRDAGPDGLCDRHTGPPPDAKTVMKLWHVEELEGGSDWFVVAPDEGIVREVLLEHEVPPENSLVCSEVDLDRPFGLTCRPDDMLIPMPGGARLEELKDGLTLAVALGRDWVALYSLPGVLACSEW